MENCSCSISQGLAGRESLGVFADVRSGCPVLRQIFVPDELWPDFKQWHQQLDTVAYHRSMLLLAMERGHLGRLTSAVHRFLITAGLPRRDIRRQYLQDLRECWMLCSEPSERHEKARMFSGRLVELQFAEWLETRAWTVSGLEALREGPDVEAFVSGDPAAAFEVKFIGTENEDFGGIVKSLAGQPAARCVSPYDAANYLLFRVYEAAKQLRRVACRRVAVIVVEELAWSRFSVQLKDGWIDWASPRFLPGHDWGAFLARQQTRHPDLPEDLAPALQSLDAVWILPRGEGYHYPDYLPGRMCTGPTS